MWCVAAPSAGFLLQTGEWQWHSGKHRNQCDKVQIETNKAQVFIILSTWVQLKKQESVTIQLQRVDVHTEQTEADREAGQLGAVIHVGTLTFRGAAALRPACHSQASGWSVAWPLHYVCAEIQPQGLKVCCHISRPLSLYCFSVHTCRLRHSKNGGMRSLSHELIILVWGQKYDGVSTNIHYPFPTLFCLSFNWPNFHQHRSCHMFLLEFLSVPGGAPSLTDWKLISTQLTFHKHSGPFLKNLPTQFKLFSGDILVLLLPQPHSCTGRPRGKWTEVKTEF